VGLSRDPESPHAICAASGKARLTRGEAKSTAKRHSRQARANIQAFKCRACGGWHVGNAPRR